MLFNKNIPLYFLIRNSKTKMLKTKTWKKLHKPITDHAVSEDMQKGETKKKMGKLKTGLWKMNGKVNAQKAHKGLQKKLTQTILKYFLPSSVIVS